MASENPGARLKSGAWVRSLRRQFAGFGGGGNLAMASLQPALSLSALLRMHAIISRPCLSPQSDLVSSAQAFLNASRAA